MSASTELQRIRKGQRRRSRRRYFSAHPEAFAKCHWCGARVVFLDRVRSSQRVSTSDPRRVVVLVGGERVTFRLGTLDHVVPLSEGGSEELSNLVAACHQCNAGRDRAAAKRYSALISHVKPCVECGRPKTGRARRRCKDCVSRGREEHLQCAAPLPGVNAGAPEETLGP